MPSTRPVEPRSLTGGPRTPFLILGAVWAAIAALWLAWLAGRIAAAVTGHSPGSRFGEQFVSDLVRGDVARLWPRVSPTLVALLFGLLLAAALALTIGGWMWWQQRRPSADDPLPSLATPADVRPLTLQQVLPRARRLRPSLGGQPDKDVEPGSAGVLLGRHRCRGRGGTTLYASWEDVLLAVMAPRAGKTTSIAVPAVLNAPGAVIATSNKPDLWATTAARRSEHGAVLVFDPQNITYAPQTWWWNPLAAVHSIETAHQLADHFVQQIRKHGNDDFWALGALDLLTSLILAAACIRGSLTDVQQWLSDSTSRTPAAILREHGYTAAGLGLSGRQAGAPETREGIYETARTAAACLTNPAIMAWVTRPSWPMPALDVDAFPTSSDTVYLLSKDSAGNAAPLVAGLTDQLMRAGVQAAERRGGRLDPPMVACLDEAANICKIRDLPELYSHFGSRGIVPLTILQSYRQGTRVWGDRGMDSLWSASTIKMVGAGIDDARFGEDLSRLIGEHDIPVASASRDGRGNNSWQTSVRRQRILDPAKIRALPKGAALLLATGVPVAMLDLMPWYAGPDAAELTAAVDAAIAQMQTDANRPLWPAPSQV